jgi:hypothetical protein
LKTFIPKLPLSHALLWIGLYVAAGALSWQFNVPSALSPYVWLPAGVSLAAALLSRHSSQIPLAIIFAATQVVLSHIGGRDLPTAILVGILAGVGPASAAAVVRAMSMSLEGLHLLKAIVVAALVSSFVVSAGGAAYFALFKGTPFLTTLSTWGAAVFVGVCITTPLLAVWAQFRPQRSALRDWSGAAIAALAFVVMLVLSWLLFGRGATLHFSGYAGAIVLYLPLFCVVIVAIAGGARGGTLAVLALATISLGATARGAGPFALLGLPQNILLLQVQLYVGVTAILVLIVHALEDEQAQALMQARQWRTHLELSLAGSNLATYCMDPMKGELRWAGDIEKVSGYSASALQSIDQVLRVVHPLDRDRLRAHWYRAANGAACAPSQIRFRLDTGHGRERWIELTDSGSALDSADGSVALMAGAWQCLAGRVG